MSIDWSQFQTIAYMSSNVEGNGILVEVVDAEMAKLEGVIYVWLDKDGNAVRVGTSKQPIGKRMLAYNPHINKSLAGLNSPTPLWEAEQWLALVTEGQLKAVCHQPPIIETVAGPLRPYLDIERHMIFDMKPTLNRSNR